MNIEIEAFTIDAYQAVFDLWKRCDGLGLSEADEKENINAYLTRNPGLSFIAKSERDIIGAVLGGHDGRRGYLHHLAVDPRFRKQGFAKQLVEKCLEGLAQANIRKCHLFLLTHNGDGQRFWESIGWTFREELGVMSTYVY